MTDTVIWHQYTPDGVDDWGDPSESTFTDVTIDAAFAPESTVEPREGGSQRVISEAKLYLDAPIEYGSRDEFTARGTRFEVEGQSMGGWENPYTGTSTGQEIMLRKVTG